MQRRLTGFFLLKGIGFFGRAEGAGLAAPPRALILQPVAIRLPATARSKPFP